MPGLVFKVIHDLLNAIGPVRFIAPELSAAPARFSGFQPVPGVAQIFNDHGRYLG